MSTQEITEQALALPLLDQVELAQALWRHIDNRTGDDPATEERQALDEVKRRDAELSSGRVTGRSHQQVMETARRALRCD